MGAIVPGPVPGACDDVGVATTDPAAAPEPEVLPCRAPGQRT